LKEKAECPQSPIPYFFFRTIRKKRMLKKQITAQVAASMIHAERVIEQSPDGGATLAK
jgi:hypothetical protein